MSTEGGFQFYLISNTWDLYRLHSVPIKSNFPEILIAIKLESVSSNGINTISDSMGREINGTEL